MRQAHRLAAAATLTLAASVLVAAPAARADDGDISVWAIQSFETEIHVGVCLTAVQALPASIDLAYTISSAGAVVASGRLGDDDPGAVVLLAQPCPRPLTSFAVVGLIPGTTYDVTVQATLTPRLLLEADDPADTIPVDPARPARQDDATASVTTPGSPPAPGAPSVPSPVDPGAHEEESPDGNADDPGDDQAIPTLDPASDRPEAVVVADPAALDPATLVTLTPEQVAAIPPDVFARLSPATLRALSSDQALRITPGQAAALTPVRAASLRPLAVRSMTTSAIRALRPTAVKRLSPATVDRLTRAQLRALTPSQVAALRPRQLAVLTAGERALLRR
jgi:hypothetical protein